MSKKCCIVLHSSLNSSKEQESHTRLLISLLDAKKLKREYIDGADECQKSKRNECFALSGIRGNYPQLFLKTIGENGKQQNIAFLGTYETIHNLNEMNDVPEELLRQNQIETLDMVVSDFERI